MGYGIKRQDNDDERESLCKHAQGDFCAPFDEELRKTFEEQSP